MAKIDRIKAEFVLKPLLIFYDCEAASGNLFNGDIIEIAARTSPSVIDLSFQSLIKTEKKLCWFAVKECGITEDKLLAEPLFPEVVKKFFTWLRATIRKANKKSSCKYFPVLCAHGGFTFDFIMLLSNMERNNVGHDILKNMKLHFADSFEFCKELQANSFKELSGIRLSMESLFSHFCSKKTFTNRHRAMGDVNAMIDIFSSGPFKDAMPDKINLRTAETMCSLHAKRSSYEEQKLILEEKMSKLDAYTKCVNVKKLLQIHLTYEGIQRQFENCCSYTDFFEVMKDIHGIDRKTAKFFACQFGGLGLKNQGTVPYCSLAKPDADLSSEEFAAEGKANEKIMLGIDETKNENYQRPVNVPEVPPDEFKIQEPTECWDDETDPNRSFTITLVKAAPALSLTIDEFVSPNVDVNNLKTENNCMRRRNNKRRKLALKKLNKIQSCFSKQDSESMILTAHGAEKNKDLSGELSTNDGVCVMLEENGEQNQVTSIEDVNAETQIKSSTVEDYASSQVESKNISAQIVNHNFDNSKSCTTDISEHPYTNQVERDLAACVILRDEEMKQELNKWPRVKILVGDIPIYVPIDPASIPKEESTVQHLVKACNDVEKQPKACILEDDISNEYVVCATSTSVDDLSHKSSDCEENSARSASNILSNYQCPICCEVTDNYVCRQSLCYFKSYNPSCIKSSGYTIHPQLFYPINMNNITTQAPSQQMFNTPGQFFPNNPSYAPMQELYSAASGGVGHHNQFKQY